jgi:hypothetical protein
VRAGAGREPLGNLAAKLAVAEPALGGRGRNSGGGHREYLREKQGGKVRAGARFAMTQVINYRGISPRNFRVHNDAISPFPRQSTPFRLEFAHFLASFRAFRHSPPLN